MGNKITKWIELHIPSSPSDLPPPIPSSQSCTTTTHHPAEYHSLYLKIGFRFSDGLLLLGMKAFWQKNAEEMFFISAGLGCNALVFSEQKKT